MNYRELADKFFAKTCQAITFKDKDEWLKLRMDGIGGSDLAGIMGVSPWNNILDIYNSKKEPKEQLKSDAIDFGNTFEPIMFNIFEAKYSKEYAVLDYKNTLFRNVWTPYLQASVDGGLVDKFTNQVGVLEIKTQQGKVSKWMNGDNFSIPIYYYYQAVHYFNTLNIDFVVFYTLINTVSADNKYDIQILKPIRINRSFIESDIAPTLNACREFWNYVKTNNRPNPRIVF